MNLPGSAEVPQAFFLPVGDGQRFCLFHAPKGEHKRGRILYLHPFAEELNTTRRIVAQQARALARAGYAVLQIDLLGCGDSSGEFADASWNAWLQDAYVGLTWLNQHASGPLWLWGMRSGALLAAQLAQYTNETTHLLLWQPVISGQQVLQQFLRLHSASQWLGATTDKPPPAATRLNEGHTVRIAGYALSPLLAGELGRIKLQPPANAACGSLIWLEMSATSNATTSPSTERQAEAWRKAGWRVHTQTLHGPAFWQIVGTDEAPALLDATLESLLDFGRYPEPSPP